MYGITFMYIILYWTGVYFQDIKDVPRVLSRSTAKLIFKTTVIYDKLFFHILLPACMPNIRNFPIHLAQSLCHPLT